MSGYQIRHLSSSQEYTRPWILVNPHKTSFPTTSTSLDSEIEAFHKKLPSYNTTPLHNLPSIASELGIASLLLKDESTRFGLPAFKILGASWAIHKSLCQRFSIPVISSLEDVRDAVRKGHVSLVTCSEGNWGRAVARMGKILEVQVGVYVPGFMSAFTRDLLRGEGAEVIVLEDGSYDDAIAATREEAERNAEAMMVMDTSWEGYEEIPRWVTDGYGTMLTETDRQAAEYGVQPNTFFVSVGVGSWAHSVAAHYQAASNRIIAVEPTVAASLKESLHCGAPTPIETGETIMAGMCCGTTSLVAWPSLRDGVHAAVIVSDLESHQSVLDLKALDVDAGPCGAATLAALRKYVANVTEEERKGMSVVLFSTEGGREYDIPTQ